jgi:hypothetical protein
VARDRLQSGLGNMLVKVNSFFPIADASGAEIDKSASLRWLAEAIWFPYVFVGDRIHWDAIDDRSARATLLQPDPSVSAIFEFDDVGKITTMTCKPISRRKSTICAHALDSQMLGIPRVRWISCAHRRRCGLGN